MQKTRENKMGTMPVKKLIISMSLPMMASMLVQALYNVVDSMFVARLSEDALTAVTLAFPMQNMLISFAAGTGVGINALLSKSLGEKRFDRADEAANNGLFLAILTYILFLLIGLFGAGPFIGTQIKDALVQEYGTIYLRIVLCMSFGAVFQITFERLLQSTGRTFYSMISQATGAIITVLGQVVAAFISLYLNITKNEDINISIPQMLHPSGEIIKKIYFVAAPSILMMSIGSIMTYAMNQILGAFSKTATAVFGVYFKLQSFFFMPVFGLNNGLIPVLAYNYGARRSDRIKEALKFSMSLAVGIMLCGTLAFQLFPQALLGMFNASEEMLRIGVPALRIISLSFGLAGACIAMGSIFQAFSYSYYSLIVSVGRQLVVLIPVAMFLATFGEVNLIWWAFPIAELMSLLLSVIFFLRLYNRTVKTL